MPNRVLIVYAHPAHDRSRANRALRAAVDGQSGVTVDDLYETYPDFVIDEKHEQRLLLEHDIIVFQHPMYWYSAPALLKEWQDAVLELGFAYGDGGDKLRGKRFMQVVTTGAPHTSYRHGGKAHFEVPELLRPFEQMAHYCGMRCLPPFVTHGARVAAERDLEARAQRYLALIERLVDGELPAPFDTIPPAE